jgi:branched-chain amino acid transport system permease protein
MSQVPRVDDCLRIAIKLAYSGPEALRKITMTMATFVQIVVSGVSISVIYMLMATGLTLIYGIMHQVNMAHGVIYMLGGMFIYYATRSWGINYFLALPIVILLFGIIGAAYEKIIFKPVRAYWLSGYLASIGAWLILEGIAYSVFGTSNKGIDFPVSGVLSLSGVNIALDRLAVAAIGLVVMAALYYIVMRTKLGRELRAVRDDIDAARLQGINPDRVSSAGFFIGCSMAALAGALVLPIFWVNPSAGFIPLLKAFIIIVIGGLGSISGTVIASFILGFTDSFVGTLVNPQIAYVLGFSIVIFVIAIKPGGIMGRE